MRLNSTMVVDDVEYVLVPKREFASLMRELSMTVRLLAIMSTRSASGEAFAAAILASPVRERFAETFRALSKSRRPRHHRGRDDER